MVLQAGARWGSCGLLHQGKEQAEWYYLLLVG